eukprot:Pgem_evm1s271
MKFQLLVTVIVSLFVFTKSSPLEQNIKSSPDIMQKILEVGQIFQNSPLLFESAARTHEIALNEKMNEKVKKLINEDILRELIDRLSQKALILTKFDFNDKTCLEPISRRLYPIYSQDQIHLLTEEENVQMRLIFYTPTKATDGDIITKRSFVKGFAFESSFVIGDNCMPAEHITSVIYAKHRGSFSKVSEQQAILETLQHKKKYYYKAMLPKPDTPTVVSNVVHELYGNRIEDQELLGKLKRTLQNKLLSDKSVLKLLVESNAAGKEGKLANAFKMSDIFHRFMNNEVDATQAETEAIDHAYEQAAANFVPNYGSRPATVEEAKGDVTYSFKRIFSDLVYSDNSKNFFRKGLKDGFTSFKNWLMSFLPKKKKASCFTLNLSTSEYVDENGLPLFSYVLRRFIEQKNGTLYEAQLSLHIQDKQYPFPCEDAKQTVRNQFTTASLNKSIQDLLPNQTPTIPTNPKKQASHEATVNSDETAEYRNVKKVDKKFQTPSKFDIKFD